jgi:hypothetical protein
MIIQNLRARKEEAAQILKAAKFIACKRMEKGIEWGLF